MATATYYTWTGASGGVWTTRTNWQGNSAPPTNPTGNPNGKNVIALLDTATSAPITLFSSGAGTIVAGSVSITANATLDINVSQTLTAGGAGAGLGALIAVNAGTVSMAGGVLIYDTISVGGGEIVGYGTITNLAGTSTIGTSNGGTIVASGGTLLVTGIGGGASWPLTASGSYDVAAGAALQFGTYSILNSPTINFGTAAGELNVVNATTAFNNGLTLLATLDNLEIGTSASSAAGASEIAFTLGNSSATISHAGFVGNGSTIQVVASTGTYYFDTNGTFTGDYVDYSVNSGTATIWADTNPCYAAGTRILTRDGEVPVDELAEGDMVVTLAEGEQVLRPVKWIGERRMNIRQHPQPNLVAPVRIRRHAFGPDLPARDLLVSPDHCLFVDGRLVPAKLLINDMTIVQERETASVHYYHVELDRHSVILAEGLPAESYLDTGNRAMFANANLGMILHPEFAVNAGLKCWETDACAPLTVRPDAVKPIWDTLADRAESLGYHRPEYTTTDDPDLRLVADGRIIRPLSSEDNRYVFTLPGGVSSVRLASRASVPSYFQAYVDDWRHLGVAVRRIVVRDDAGLIEIPPDHPGLARGWHQVEHDDATMWRWMDGDAVLPIQTDGPAVVEVQVGIAMRHVVADSENTRQAA